MKKRFLCIMLVLLMASALLPAGAFAAEGGKALRRGTDGLIPCIGEKATGGRAIPTPGLRRWRTKRLPPGTRTQRKAASQWRQRPPP